MSPERFRVKRLPGTAKNDAVFHAVEAEFNDGTGNTWWGQLTAFGGTDGGKAEATRYCNLLNAATEKFYNTCDEQVLVANG